MKRKSCNRRSSNTHAHTHTHTLYCDTDSMILISKPGEWESRRGHYLGEMTDELSDTNGANSIQTFVLVLDLKIMPLNLLVQIKKVIQQNV